MFVAILALLLAKVLVSFMVQNKKTKTGMKPKLRSFPVSNPPS